MSQIDKQQLINWSEQMQKATYDNGLVGEAAAYAYVTLSAKEGKFDSPVDYQQRYEALVQAVELLIETNEARAASCSKMMSGDLPFEQRSRVVGKYEAYRSVANELKTLREDDSND